MKKILALTLSLVLALSLCACGGGNADTTTTDNGDAADTATVEIPPVEDLTGTDTSAIPGVEVRTVFFDPVNSLVSGSMTEQQWIDGIKSASDQMRANIIE